MITSPRQSIASYNKIKQKPNSNNKTKRKTDIEAVAHFETSDIFRGY